MKIAYLIPSLVNKGPIIVVQSLANALFQQGHDVDVYYFDDIFGATFNCPTIKLNPKSLPDFDQYNIVHSHMYRPDKLLSEIKKGFTHAKAVSTIHAHIEKDLAYSYNKLISAFFSPLWIYRLRKMHMIVTISEFLEKTYQNKFSQISTVYNGIDIDVNIECANKQIVAQIQELKKTYKIIGSYAYITPRKGLHQVINILPSKKNWAMVIIGEGKEKDNLKQLAQTNNVADRVLFLPYQKEPYNYLPLFDLYAMTSYSEGFGLALIEAAQAKIPAVCSDIPVFRELFNHKEVVFFTLDNKTALSDAIDIAYHNGNISVEKACKRVTTNYTVCAMVNRYLSIYQKMMIG